MIDPINVYSVKGLNEKILYFLCVLITVSTVFQFIPLFFCRAMYLIRLMWKTPTLFANKEKRTNGVMRQCKV